MDARWTLAEDSILKEPKILRTSACYPVISDQLLIELFDRTKPERSP